MLFLASSQHITWLPMLCAGQSSQASPKRNLQAVQIPLASAKMADGEVRIISSQIVQTAGKESETGRVIHLTPWDLKNLSIDNIQKGILLPLPPATNEEEEEEAAIIPRLLSSFSKALSHFYPFAGRLSTTHHPTTPPSLSISLVCTNDGAEFIHASATHISISDLLSPLRIPTVVWSFFPLNKAVGYDGHSLPLLAVQVTELADGVFVACSLNHVVADGTSFWHFFNAWSEISRTGHLHTVPPPHIDPWFLESAPPPIRLPFRDRTEFVRRPPSFPPAEECFFHFSTGTVAKLKAKANEEMATGNKISSLQALLGHVWRSVTRARGQDSEQETLYVVLAGCRSRVSPPLPHAYLGNAVIGILAKASAGEVSEKGLGWVAWKLNQAIASQMEESVIGSWLESWLEKPSIAYMDEFNSWSIGTGSSPRFDVYGNDFGWGKPTAVRSGGGNKFDGKVTVYPGPEEGSMALEVCLSPQALSSLVEDREFMETVDNDAMV